VLEGVTLSVGHGELVGLIGPNGAGKTTLIRTVLGLVPIEEGSVLIDGRPPRGGRAGVGYVPQRHEVCWDFPISVAGAVLSSRARAIGMGRRPRAADLREVEEAIARVGLADLRHRPIGHLSGGQRQRVLVARALAVDPRLLLLDEPFAALDAPTQDLLTGLFTELARDRAILMSTHDLPAAMDSCDRLCLLNRTVVAQAAPADLRDPDVWLEAFGVATLLQRVARGPSLPPEMPAHHREPTR
jgi:manganese/iron transport system ATP-binding protein